MTTALGMITSSMKKIKVLTKSETPSADEAADGLASLNGMLSLWSNETLLVYARTWETFTLTPGIGTYTIGTGQALNTARPTAIIEAHVSEGTISHPPMSIKSDEVYNALPDKTSQGLPDILNFDNDFPVAKIRLYRVPVIAYVLNLLSEKPLTSFTLNQTVSLPPGWEHTIIHNLAVVIAPEFGVDVPPLVAKEAVDSKSLLMATVNRNRQLPYLPANGGRGNIYTGWWT